MKIQRESESWKVSGEALERLRAIERRIEPDDPQLAAWASNYCDQHRLRLAADLRIIERNVPAGAAILECGAVPLVTTVALSELGFGVRAVDIAPERFGSAIESLSLDVRKCDLELEPLPFDSATFRAVVFHELFEHLRIDPIRTMLEVRRVLEPGGLLLLSTPNLRSFRGLRNLILRHQATIGSTGVYRQYEKLSALGHMGHVREYTVQEVAEFLSQIGFQVEKVIFRGGHGRGVVGLAERLAPSMRPFFSLISVRKGGRRQ